MENNWRFKSLENLEKEKCCSDDSDYPIVKRVTALRKIPLNEYSVEDLRLMIGQQEGLIYLIPLAIEVLTNNILAEGDFYEGDLLQNVLRLNPEFWKANKDYRQAINDLIAANKDLIDEFGIDISKF